MLTSVLQALVTFRNKTTIFFAMFMGCGFIILGSVFPVRTQTLSPAHFKSVFLMYFSCFSAPQCLV